MSVRRTLIVLVLFLLLGAWALKLAWQPGSGKKDPLLKVAADDVLAVTLSYPDKPRIVLQRAPKGAWRVAAPIRAEADDGAVKALLDAVAGCQIERTVEEKAEDLPRFGLDKPRAVVTLTTTNTTLPAIEVGRSTPVGYSTYVKRADRQAVYLVAGVFASDMTKRLSQLRSRRLMRFVPDEVNRIVLDHRGQPPIDLDRTGKRWKIVKPAGYQADSQEVKSLLDALAEARVARFVDDSASPQLSAYGLDQAEFTVSLFAGKSNARQSLMLAEPPAAHPAQGELYARRGEGGSVYSVGNWLLSSLDRPLLDLRDKTVLDVHAQDVGEARVTRPDGAYSLKRAEQDRWLLLRQGGRQDPAAQGAANAFVFALADLRGQAIVEDPMKDPKDFGLDHPSEEIGLIDRKGKTLATVKLGEVKAAKPAEKTAAQKVSDRYYAASSTSRAVYSLSAYSFSQADKPASAFVPAKTPAPAPSAKPK